MSEEKLKMFTEGLRSLINRVIQDLQDELHVTRERLRALEYFVKQADIK